MLEFGTICNENILIIEALKRQPHSVQETIHFSSKELDSGDGGRGGGG